MITARWWVYLGDMLIWGIPSPSSCHTGQFLYLHRWRKARYRHVLLTQVFHITSFTLSAAADASGLYVPTPLQPYCTCTYSMHVLAQQYDRTAHCSSLQQLANPVNHNVICVNTVWHPGWCGPEFFKPACFSVSASECVGRFYNSFWWAAACIKRCLVRCSGSCLFFFLRHFQWVLFEFHESFLIFKQL